MYVMKALLRTIVTSYLANFPITEGKKHVYRFASKHLMPTKSEVIGDMKHGFKLNLNLKNKEHQHYFFYKQHDERYEVNNLSKLIKSGDCCWDIGGNIGYYACLFSKLVGSSGKVYSFEPVTKTFEMLSSSKSLNSFSQMHPMNFAFGNQETMLQIYTENAGEGHGTASLVHQSEGYSETVSVKVIDKELINLRVPDFIKIDVEGFQEQVIRGATHFLQTNAPILMIEIDQDDFWLEQYFLGLQYELYAFKKRGLKKVDTMFGHGRNILFVPASKKAKIESLILL